MIDYFEIKDNSVIEDLKMLIKSKKYENIIKSINYFFKNFKNKEIMISKKKIIIKMISIYQGRN